MLLQGKTALITGGSRGIGAAIASLFLKEGAKVIITASGSESLQFAFDRLGPEVSGYVCNFENPGDIRNLAKQIQADKCDPDILVNNAGIMEDAVLMLSRDEMILRQVQINLSAPMMLTREIIKTMARKKSGSIIQIASVIGVNGNAGQSVYAATKAGIIGFTRSLAKELAPLQIRVNAVAPGFVDTDLVSGYSDELREKTIAKIGMKKAGDALEVAQAVLFLASENSTYITGQVLGVDGGMII